MYLFKSSFNFQFKLIITALSYNPAASVVTVIEPNSDFNPALSSSSFHKMDLSWFMCDSILLRSHCFKFETNHLFSMIDYFSCTYKGVCSISSKKSLTSKKLYEIKSHFFWTGKLIFAKVWQRIIVTKSRMPKTYLSQKTHAGTCGGDKSQKCLRGCFSIHENNRYQAQSISSKL